MFILRASVWPNGLKQFRSDILQEIQAACETRATYAKFLRPKKPEYSVIDAKSVAYEVTSTP